MSSSSSQSDASTPRARSTSTSFPVQSTSYQAFQLPMSTPEGPTLPTHTLPTTSTAGLGTSPYLDVRPGLGPRSISSPPAEFLNPSASQVSGLSEASSRVPNSVTGELNSPSGASPHRGRERSHRNPKSRITDKKEWTVFGQLMEGHRAAVSSAASLKSRSLSRPGRSRSRHRRATVALPTTESTSGNSVTVQSIQGADRITLQPSSSSSTATVSPRMPASLRPIETQIASSPPKSFGPNSSIVSSPRRITEEPFPAIHILEGEEALVAHHHLSTEAVGTRPPSHRDTNGIYSKKQLSRSPSFSQSSHSDSSDSSDSDEEASEEPSPRPSTAVNPMKRKWFFLGLPTLTVLQRNVLKCSLAYFFASLFTFVPYLSSFIADISSFGHGHGRPSPSAHMVATV